MKLLKTNEFVTGRSVCRGLMVIFSNDQSFNNEMRFDGDSNTDILEPSFYIQKP